MVRFLPHNIQWQLCDPLVTSAVENINWCTAAEEKGCYSEEIEQDWSEESVNIQELVESLNILSTNQETIYNQMNSSFVQLDNYYTSLEQMMSNLSSVCSAQQYYVEPAYVEEPAIDEREQQRLELQAQIEALQNEMNNL